MGVLAYAKKQFPDEKDDKQALVKYLNTKDSEMEWDVNRRIFGVRNKTGGYLRAGYNISRQFYEGDQWFHNREEGSAMNVTNFCRMTVDNFTAFMTQEEPEIDIPPRDAKDDIELSRVKEVEKLINDIFEENNWFEIYQEGVQNGSILGDTMIAGPFFSKEKQKIWWTNIKRPEFVRIIWDSNEYTNIVGYIYHYLLSVEEAELQFGKELEKQEVELQSVTVVADTRNNTTANPQQTATESISRKVLIRELWDDEVRLLMVGDHPLEKDVHNFGFVPIIYIKNHPHPLEPYGISDIEDLLDPQVKYNEVDSDMQDILKQVAFASIFGKNIDLEEIQAGVSKIYDMGDDSEVFQDPRNTNFPFLQTYLGDKKGDIDIMSGVPDVFQGGKSVRDVSGRALSVLLTPINNKIRGKEKRWTTGIKTLVKNIEILIEKFVPNGKDLIQGWYEVDVFFPGTLVRDVTEELNKFIQKIQSQQTTMKNIGIASPKDEQVIMKKELSDPQLIVELSRSPQLQLAIAQQIIQAAQQRVSDRNARSANAPVQTEGQNQSGDQPASAANVPVGSTTSPEGAVASQGGGPPVIPNP